MQHMELEPCYGDQPTIKLLFTEHLGIPMSMCFQTASADQPNTLAPSGKAFMLQIASNAPLLPQPVKAESSQQEVQEMRGSISAEPGDNEFSHEEAQGLEQNAEQQQENSRGILPDDVSDAGDSVNHEVGSNDGDGAQVNTDDDNSDVPPPPQPPPGSVRGVAMDGRAERQRLLSMLAKKLLPAAVSR